jgi:hypothetical protein
VRGVGSPDDLVMGVVAYYCDFYATNGINIVAMTENPQYETLVLTACGGFLSSSPSCFM